MNESEATNVAMEVLWQVRRCRDNFPGAYEYIVGEMDISNREFNRAVKILLPAEYKTL